MKAAGFLALAGMAFRSLGRHRVKTVITTVAVTVSVALYIVMDAWLLGMNLDSRRNIVSYEIGAAKIQSRAYFERKDELPMYEGFGGWEALAGDLAEAGYDSAPRFVFSGTLYSRSGTAPIVFNGVEPERDARLFRYPDYLEAGRFIRGGRAELAVGTMAADKLRIGIPRRPTKAEFESEILPAASNADEAAFIGSLYVPAPLQTKARSAWNVFSVEEPSLPADNGRLALKEDCSAAETRRLWDILAASGRMDVRISTVIDMKAAPLAVSKNKFEADLLPSLTAEGRDAVRSAYVLDEATAAYLLSTEDEALLASILEAMVAAEFSGAIRHVNQLIDAVVVGVVNSPNPKTNGNVGYMPLDALQDETGLMLGGQVTELLVRKAGADDARLPGKTESPAAILAALGATLPVDLEVRAWPDYVADYLAASAGDNVSTRVMIVFLFILSFIGISNTMLMAILERTKEIGMLRALGMSDGQLVLAYVMEAGLVGFIGSMAGILIGCLVTIPMVRYGIDYSGIAKEMGGDFGYRITAFFRSAWNPPVIAGTGVAATALSALAAIPPLLRALRMAVTDSLRFE